MKGVKFVAFLVVFASLWGFSSEADVYCEFKKSCLLKDSFKASDEVVIHWLQTSAGDAPVHSYYHNGDQLTYQDPRFRHRTKLFLDKISEGNASLLLTETHFKDSGRYKCYTSTVTSSHESFTNLKVHAPVRRVSLQQLGDIIICSSDGIHPAPELSWTPGPPLSNQSPVSSQLTDQHLYNVSSSLTLSADGNTEVNYTCQVSTERSSKTASFLQMSQHTVSNSEVKITCSTSNAPLTSLVWSFNQSETILTRSGPLVDPEVSEGWGPRVKGVSPSGVLTLHDLTPEQEGVYTCQLSNAEETFLSNTVLRIEEGGSNKVAVELGVTIPLVLIAGIGIGCYCYCKIKREEKKTRVNTEDLPF